MNLCGQRTSVDLRAVPPGPHMHASVPEQKRWLREFASPQWRHSEAIATTALRIQGS